jgi:hypothetical protein
MVAPIGKGYLKYSGQLFIVAILMYILFKNFTETHNFLLVQKKMKEKKKDDKEEEISDDTMIDIKNNTIASYVLCGFILILLLYVIYSIFD